MSTVQDYMAFQLSPRLFPSASPFSIVSDGPTLRDQRAGAPVFWTNREITEAENGCWQPLLRERSSG